MKPITEAVDNMQGENTVESYFGSILPTRVIQRKLSSFTSTYTASLVSALQAGLQKRFGDILNFDDVHNNNNKMKAFVVAAVAHLYFKVRRLSTSLRKMAEDLFLAEVIRLGESCCRPQANDKADTSEDFYSFSMHDSDSEVADSRCKAEALQFLNDSSHELGQQSVCQVQHQYSIISSCRDFLVKLDSY